MSSVIKRSEKHFKLQKQTVFRYTKDEGKLTVHSGVGRLVGLSSCQSKSENSKTNNKPQMIIELCHWLALYQRILCYCAAQGKSSGLVENSFAIRKRS